jgi:hypothetical protein
MAIYRVEVPLNGNIVVAQPPFSILSAVVENLTSSSCILRDNAGNTYRNYAGQINKLTVQPSMTMQMQLEGVATTGQCIVTLSDVFASESAQPGYAGAPSTPPNIPFYDRQAMPQTISISLYANESNWGPSQTIQPFNPLAAYYIHSSHLSVYVYEVVSMPFPSFISTYQSVDCRLANENDTHIVALINRPFSMHHSMLRKGFIADISYPLGLWAHDLTGYKIVSTILTHFVANWQIRMMAQLTINTTTYAK